MAEMSTWEKIFLEKGLYWCHDGNPTHPHALLTSGKHSSGFFNGSGVISDPRLCAQACKDLLALLDLPSGDFQVFGSALGASTLAYEMARQTGMRCGFTEPVVDEITKKKSMKLKRFSFKSGTYILVCEDVMTTGGTTLETIAALEAAGGNVLGDIAVLVNRSGKSTLNGRGLIALVDRELPTWDPAKEICPLCAGGSEVVRPKAYWGALTNPK
ncbi:MAG: Orotate phosphoribosyltransferase [Parcubacteria group bacterium GW2011_GWC2_39_14]|nr:MAG: Orotate phosphoribosyltransferase [Parcubacteria group bacterium GW2011_GWC2_39_14]KKR54966.1 MAG: Orotate phosphoribosyltransferase [Parcubacteria group bacterium GW2011_GWA2_40_23]